MKTGFLLIILCKTQLKIISLSWWIWKFVLFFEQKFFYQKQDYRIQNFWYPVFCNKGLPVLSDAPKRFDIKFVLVVLTGKRGTS